MSMTLAIMAAGIGSRFEDGCKQLTPVGPAGEVILEYSVYDALEAGFDHIVFIIRKNLEADFRARMSKLEKRCKVDYAFQDMDDLPEGFTRPAERTKPWGTGHAVLAAEAYIDGPFAVINADDYYGKETFRIMFDFMQAQKQACDQDPDHKFMYSMPGFVLGNTLSDHGKVTRGLCSVDAEGKLATIDETRNIMKTADGAETEGRKLDPSMLVSMNMWGLDPEFMGKLKSGFVDFLSSVPAGDLTSEYLLPIIIGGMMQDKSAVVQVLKTEARWFGLTYKEDTPIVKEALQKMTADGIYPTPLF